jgi:N-acetylated-alpha-linked acidic dipeptidase
VGEVWDKRIETMGSGSDFTAFQDFAGIPSLDIGFNADSNTPIYHYHSNYDSFHWMEKFGDPSFQYHATIAQIWGLMAANLVETPVIQLNATDYAIGLKRYVGSVKEKAKNAKFLLDEEAAEKLFVNLDEAISRLTIASQLHDSLASFYLQKLYADDIPWWKWWEKVKLFYAIRAINTKYKLLERQFLYAPGLDGRSWFKHVVFAPGKWTGYSGATFPGIVEAIEDNDKQAAEKWIGIITGLVAAAADSLTPAEGS